MPAPMRPVTVRSAHLWLTVLAILSAVARWGVLSFTVAAALVLSFAIRVITDNDRRHSGD